MIVGERCKKKIDVNDAAEVRYRAICSALFAL